MINENYSLPEKRGQVSILIGIWLQYMYQVVESLFMSTLRWPGLPAPYDSLQRAGDEATGIYSGQKEGNPFVESTATLRGHNYMEVNGYSFRFLDATQSNIDGKRK
jgi:hypothetical protein